MRGSIKGLGSSQGYGRLLEGGLGLKWQVLIGRRVCFCGGFDPFGCDEVSEAW